MYLTGFADEASKVIEGQIRATKELGWEFIELRSVNGVNVTDIPEAEFEAVADKLDQAEVKVNCFGSAVANWAKQITDDFDISISETRRAINRMKRLNTKLIRIMSYAVLEGRGPDDQMEQERFRRLRKLNKMFTEAGITPVHENCMNYGGMGWTYTLKLIENVPGLKLVFDTGNPVFSDDRTWPKPYPKQSAWEFYEHVKQHIAYVHIKDSKWDQNAQKPIFTFPGEGHGDIIRIVKDLLANGYDGGLSIEPHLAVVHHEKSVKPTEQIMYDNYIEYGRRMEKIIADIKSVSQ